MFVVEVAHKSNNVRLLYTCKGVSFAEHPAGMGLELTVAVADELEK
jgi:anti-sigma factor ChrR (cupin superfamily)